MIETLIALGANLGDKGGAIEEAVAHLAVDPRVELVSVSEILKTSPIGVPDSDETFLNAAARFRVAMSPQEWLETLLETERVLGRKRTVRWGARKIDLDLLLFGQQTIRSAPLLVPHPRMGFRRFVMQPAVEIAADLWHPLCRCTLGELWTHLNQAANWVIWSPLDQEDLEWFDGAQFNVPVRRWRFSERPNDPLDLALAESMPELSRWLSERPVSGPGAAAVMMGVPWTIATQGLPSALARAGILPKLVVRRADEPSWYDALPDSDTPRLELELERTSPLRIAQEVTGALESLLML